MEKTKEQVVEELNSAVRAHAEAREAAALAGRAYSETRAALSNAEERKAAALKKWEKFAKEEDAAKAKAEDKARRLKALADAAAEIEAEE